MFRDTSTNVIPGFTSLSKQQLFNMSAAHVIKNGKSSRDDRTGRCIYSGIGCAAAPFLTKDARENLSAPWDSLCFSQQVPNHEADFILHLQRCHDRARPTWGLEFIASYKKSMRELATSNYLSAAVLDKDN